MPLTDFHDTGVALSQSNATAYVESGRGSVLVYVWVQIPKTGARQPPYTRRAQPLVPVIGR